MLICCSDLKHFLLLSTLKTVVLHIIFLWKPWCICPGFFDEYKVHGFFYVTLWIFYCDTVHVTGAILNLYSFKRKTLWLVIFHSNILICSSSETNLRFRWRHQALPLQPHVIFTVQSVPGAWNQAPPFIYWGPPHNVSFQNVTLHYTNVDFKQNSTHLRCQIISNILTEVKHQSLVLFCCSSTNLG